MSTDLSCAKATPLTVFPRLPLVANLSFKLQDSTFLWFSLSCLRRIKRHAGGFSSAAHQQLIPAVEVPLKFFV